MSRKSTARERALEHAAVAGGATQHEEVKPQVRVQKKPIRVRQPHDPSRTPLNRLKPGDVIESVPGLLRSPVVVKVDRYQVYYTTFTDRSRTRLSQNIRLYFAQDGQTFNVEGTTNLILPDPQEPINKEGQMATVTRSKKPGTTKAKSTGAAKAKTNGEGKPGGRPRVTFTKAQLEKSAKMKRDGKTWNEIRESLGVKTSSGQFQKLWDENGIDRPATRERSAPGTAKAASTKADDKGAQTAAARKGSGKKVVKRASKANPSK